MHHNSSQLSRYFPWQSSRVFTRPIFLFLLLFIGSLIGFLPGVQAQQSPEQDHLEQLRQVVPASPTVAALERYAAYRNCWCEHSFRSCSW